MAWPPDLPQAQGLYNPAFEHDACGVAMVATLNKVATHAIVSKALSALKNLEHRGASGAEPDSGDGAGILIRVPDQFFRAVLPFTLPEVGAYVAGIAFIDDDYNCHTDIEVLAQEEGLRLVGWRELPINSSTLGKTALSVMPKFEQVFLAGLNGETGLILDRMAFCLRKRVEHRR